MRSGVTFTLLLLTAGLTLMPTGVLRADDASAKSGCNDRLIGIEQRLQTADLAARKEAQVRQIIDGARTLDQLGDSGRCTDLANQLDRLLKIF
jgi:hypothetical protein